MHLRSALGEKSRTILKSRLLDGVQVSDTKIGRPGHPTQGQTLDLSHILIRCIQS